MIMGDTKMNNFATRAIEGLLFRKPELFLVSNLKFPVDLMGELKFSKKYLDNNELRDYLQLPEGLTLSELYQLNINNDYGLHWQLLESDVSNHDIDICEKILGAKIPRELQNYLQSFALPISYIYGRFTGDWFRQTYDEKIDSLRIVSDDEDIVTTELKLFPTPKGGELNIFLRDNSPFYKSGYIYIGTVNDNYQLFVNSYDGHVICIDEEYIDETSTQSIRYSLSEMSFVLFYDFYQLLKCYFLGYEYDIDKHQFVNNQK